MLPLEPLPAATKALQFVRKNQPVPLEEGELGDLEREALEEGLPAWVQAKGGFLYLAANASWPELYKIGCTRRTVAQRLASLSGTGVATPWVEVASWWVPDAHGVEALVHQACARFRVKGELFHADRTQLRDLTAAVCAGELACWRRHLGAVVGEEAVEQLFRRSARTPLH